ncbi:MAG: histidine kinase [Chitinophagaceae bacterium]|nr:histidine kinase [Chitinophagaceae bacterium]
MKVYIAVWLWCLMHPSVGLHAQLQRLHFRQITVADGLIDGTINAIGQDKYGFMWFASLGGINRYNGHLMRLFTHVPGDSTSPLGSFVESMVSDEEGRFWLGYETGLQEFDFSKQNFREIKVFSNLRINSMMALPGKKIFLFTDAGPVIFDTESESATYLKDIARNAGDRQLLSFRAYEGTWFQGKLLIATRRNLLEYDTAANTVSVMKTGPMEGLAITSVAVDARGNLWLGTQSRIQLARRTNDGSFTIYDHFLSTDVTTLTNNINHVFTDKQGVLWVATTMDGLLQYNAEADHLIGLKYRPGVQGSPIGNLFREAFVDRDGLIWLGGNTGINYFNPKKQFFEVIMPFADSLEYKNRRETRALTEDNDGKLWMGTMDGVSCFDPKTGKYRVWKNSPGKPRQIYYNSIRGTLADDDGNVWIATGSGVNKFNKLNGTMEFIPRDLLPYGFYFGISKDRKGNIWFATRDFDGLYLFDKQTRIFKGIGNHPQMKVFSGLGGRIVYEDSKGRYWLGFNGAGLGFFDPRNGKTRIWNTSLPKNKTIIGNLVFDICEDHRGVIWVSTNNGITGITIEQEKYQSFNLSNGLLGNAASALAVDSINRLWIATTRGLNMLDSTRTVFISFGIDNGLPTDGFPEYRSLVTRNGDFIFPGNSGYIRFNPMHYKPPAGKIPVYLSEVFVQNKPFRTEGEISDIKAFRFRHDENAFRFSFASPNYDNPAQTWFAYKLEGFDDEWLYTQKNEINYTNVPGGRYTLLFKASNNSNDWNVPEHKVLIHVKTIFYNTLWFRMISLLTIAGLLYIIYRYRIRQKERLIVLQSRTQQLEKEKAMVMYENLKQHLNPHFLFNSLTSLSSLIRLDQQMAGDFLEKMSRIYRYILKNRDSETVTLKEELGFVSNYIELQKTRFESGLQVNMQVDEEHLYKKIAPVTLQNLVENAIKHNTTSKQKPLIIDFYAEDDYLFVKNNLQRKSFVETSNKTGLNSMKDLYSYLSHRPLIVEETETSFVVKVPLL